MIAWAAMGDANASIPTPQPVLPRPMFGAAPAAAAATSVHFVAPQAIEDGLADRLAVNRRLVAGRRRPQGRQGATCRSTTRLPRDRGRPRHVHRAHRRRGLAGAARRRTADGAAILPVLMIDQPGDPAGAGRLPAADRRARALRRRRGGRHQRAGRRPRDAAGVPAPPDPHPGSGDGVRRRRGARRHAVASRAADRETDARTPAPAARQASRAQGRGLLRLARRVWPDRRLGRARRHTAPRGGGGRGRRGRAACRPSTPRCPSCTRR